MQQLALNCPKQNADEGVQLKMFQSLVTNT